ncbi:STAS domain-containing protein [Micromonospora sp. NPDC050187]|uniref:STAS domain-containing protein n=1 Tax=Micromonospora sp. NPDC050187 TaxID=3364277 RepID=UPI0037A1BEB6
MTFTVTHVQRDGGGVRLRLAGELDMSTAPHLATAIDGLLADGEVRLLVDLVGLTFCDSTGIAAFLRGDNACAAAGGWLRLTGANGRVERVLRMTGLAEVLRYDPTADPASHAHH